MVAANLAEQQPLAPSKDDQKNNSAVADTSDAKTDAAKGSTTAPAEASTATSSAALQARVAANGASGAGADAGATANSGANTTTTPAKADAAALSAPPPVDASTTGAAQAAVPAPTSAPTSALAASVTANLSLSHLSHAAIEATAQIAAQITRRLEARSTRFEMALTPDDLGRVDVSLDIDADGRLAARLAFDNPLAATELRGRADELRRQLEAAGFTLADDALNFAQRDPSAGGGFDRRPSPSSAYGARLNRAEAVDLNAALPPAWVSLSLTPTGVDMKV